MSADPSTPFQLGVFVGNANGDDSSAEATFDAANQAFDTLMGTTPTIMNAYIDASQTPDEWLSNVGWSAGSAEASPSWKGEIPLIGLPMGSTNPDAPSTMQILQNYADGAYDSMLQGMVRDWANAGFMTQYWRPGVEMNLSSTPGFVGSDAALQQEWIAAFQHIYTTLHAAAAADGVNLKVIWNPGTTNDSVAGNPTQTMYPGNQYVDIIGADVYADAYPFGNHSEMYDWDKSGQVINSPNPVYDSSFQQWASDPINLEHYYTYPASDQYSLDGSGGSALSLQNLIDFAKAQGKPIAVCEAGAGSTGDGAGVSDNPTFVQWLSSTLDSSGATVDFVSIWDSNGGGNYEFSNASDDKPLEAAAWAKYFGAQSATVTKITITSATTAVSTTDAVSVKPFTSVAITDNNSGQTETAIVTMSSAANGTFSDPNAATDGSAVASGIWSVSGSATAVAAALDGLVFKPTANQVAAGSSVTTTLRATITDSAGETASATSTVKAIQPASTHAMSAAHTQVNGTTGTIYDASGNAWTINSSQQIAENGTVVPSSAEVVTLFWTGTALDQLNTSGDWWTQPLSGTAGTELSGSPAGYTGPMTAISMTPATEAVATTDATKTSPFKGIVITDANAGQTETARVTMSTAANGTLSDPNAATDGSTVTGGVWTVSGSMAKVATALDGLVFTPMAHEVAPKATVTTTLTAAIADTGGETTSTKSTVTAKAVAVPITITPATKVVSTTDATSVRPFTSVVITDANAGQTETARVTLSAAANGTLSDPNEATDGSTIANGVLTVTGSATAVATALDALVFKPKANEVVEGASVTTKVTASITDTAGETVSAKSTITATQPSAAKTQISGTTGTIYDTSGNAWTINGNERILENGTVVPSSAEVVTLFWTGTALDQLNTSGDWWTQPLGGTAGTELSGAPAGYAGPLTAITITPATKAVSTTDAASVKPFTSVVVTDANAGQTETAKVSLSATANGTLSDPNAATDGSTIANGVLTVTGSATAVATALDALVFKPKANEVPAGTIVTTKVTASITDIAGDTASAASTVTATQVAVASATPDTLALQISEDAWNGDAEFTVSVDGKQIGGDYTASALHSSGDAGTFLLTGKWDMGINDVQVSFINDAYGGTPQTDRNLYVDSVAYNGVTYTGTTASLLSNGTDTFVVGGTTAPAADTATAPADDLTIKLSEEAWSGNAEFVLYIDGKAVTTPQVVTALHDAAATQAFSYAGDLGAGTHTIGIGFMNDADGGTTSSDRNLYIDGITVNGASVFSGSHAMDGNGVATFAFTTTH